jgi:protein ImuB
VLAEIARACSPRVEVHGDRTVVFDASGLGRVIGAPPEIAREVQALAADYGLHVRIALAATRVAAWLLAHERPGITVIDAAETARALAPLPTQALATLPGSARRRGALAAASASHARSRAVMAAVKDDAITTLTRWGLRTLGQVAALPRADVHTRLGDEGVRLHQAARGEDADPLVPAGDTAPFLERAVLEWPIEGLEPLTFVLSRMCDALSVSLERADRGAVTITTTLQLVSRASHQRTLNLPAPMRESKTLRTLILLDLESHPPNAGIDVVTVGVDVVPSRIVQGSLLDRALPAPEQIATLTARLRALVGESRVGAPAVIDSHDDRGAGMQPFAVTDVPRKMPASALLTPAEASGPGPRSVVRRFRLPIAARVDVERGGPVRVVASSSSIPPSDIVNRAGPWHSSGRWWALDRTNWDRDEWDVELAGGGCYRLARDRKTGNWEIEGEID